MKRNVALTSRNVKEIAGMSFLPGMDLTTSFFSGAKAVKCAKYNYFKIKVWVFTKVSEFPRAQLGAIGKVFKEGD